MSGKLNILYISIREPHLRQGPTYSIPAQIKAQAKYDNVLWLNLVNSDNPSLKELFKQVDWKNLSYYKDLSDFPSPCLAQLPAPFNKPDLIVYEQFYLFAKHILFVRQIIKSDIPYIIVPRGEFTHSAQYHRAWKKKLVNFFFFSYFARHAKAIEYLTNQEKETSGPKWNKNGIVIPNGITLPEISPKVYTKGKFIKLVYVGRLDIFHKGLDLLLQACVSVKEVLAQANVSLDIYGPDLWGFSTQLQNMIETLGLQNIVRMHGPLYKGDKIKVLQQADVFIMTSRFEGHPMGLIEALAYGLPCVVTTGTNMRDEIDKFNAGWTADTTAESIATALTKMLSERDQLAIKSQQARTLASQYDWNQIAAKSHQIYEEIIRGNK